MGLLWVWGYFFSNEKEGTIPRSLPIIVFLLYLLIFIISALAGFMPSLSFWGTFDHGAGMVFMLCLFLFTLITCTVFKKREEWQTLFLTLISGGILFTLGTFMAEAGFRFSKIFKLNATGGFTIGNSSWAGVYLGLLFFISLGIFFSSQKRTHKILALIGAVVTLLNPIITGLIIPAPDEASRMVGLARTAFYSMGAGLGLLGLYFVYRKIRVAKWRKIFLGLIGGLILLSVVMVAIRPNIVRQVISEKAGPNRLIFWGVAMAGFKDRPLLGWGSDTYQFVYTKHFNPVITSPGYLPEYWVDRSHNIYFDELASGGILGFISLIIFYGVLLFGFIRKALLKFNDPDGWLFMALAAGLVSFLLQGVMLFQTTIGWILVALLTAFSAHYCYGKEITVTKKKWHSSQAKYGFTALAIVAFFFLFNHLIIKPFAISKGLAQFPSWSFEQRMEFYDKLQSSTLGKNADLGNAFNPYHVFLRKVLASPRGPEEKQAIARETARITQVLDSTLQKEKYLDMKLLMAETGFYSILTSLSSGEERKANYDAGMFYVEKMREVSPQNPIQKSAATILQYSYAYGEEGLKVLNTD